MAYRKARAVTTPELEENADFETKTSPCARVPCTPPQGKSSALQLSTSWQALYGGKPLHVCNGRVVWIILKNQYVSELHYIAAVIKLEELRMLCPSTGTK